MAVSRLKLANPQPLVTLKYNFYQDAFMQARRQRFCPEGHVWSRLNHEHCPTCAELFGRQEAGNRAYKRFLLRAGRRGGKALDLTTPIPTPSGWTTMGTLRVGDAVFDERGAPARVSYTSPIFVNHDCFALTFSDGSTIVADADHEWVVWPKRSRKRPHLDNVQLTTRELADQIRTPNGEESNWAIQAAYPLDCAEVDLPVAPYTLGAWLGDGSSASAEICCTEQGILDEIMGDGYAIGRKRGGKDKAAMYTIGGTGATRCTRTGRMAANGSLNSTLKRLGLIKNKHVPAIYLRASSTQRLRLLQGLMDTDGHVNPKGDCEFDSTNERLALAVKELAISLGAIARIYEGKARLYGRVIGPKWRVTFNTGVPVFRLVRKSARLERRRHRETALGPLRYLVSAVRTITRPVRCIQVDSPSHLFLAGTSMIPTHNTRIGALAAIEEATIPGSVGWCCAPTYPELEDFVLPAFFKQIPQAWLDHPLTEWSESEYTLLLPNRSIVQFRSLEDPDRGRGPGLHWLWIDEICKLSKRHWETIRPTLTEHKGILIGTTTPKGEDWVHETFYETAEASKPGYWACVYRTVDNPIIDAAEVQEAKDSMTPEMYKQEYEADIVTFTGAIFGDFVPPCIIEGSDEQMKYYFPEWPNLDPSRECVMGIDPGTDHPFGAGKWVTSPHGLVKVGEYLDRNKPFQLHAQQVNMLKGASQCRIAIDRSAAQAQIELAQYGLFTVQADNDVVAGINRMLSWMIASKQSIAKGATLPRGMVLPKSLVPRTIKQYQSYRWADNEKKDGSTKHRELVHKRNDDLIDPDRYALMLYPHLPADQPVGAEAGKRDLSAMPEYYRAQVERMRRIEKSGSEDGKLTPVAMESDASVSEEFGMGEFNG